MESRRSFRSRWTWCFWRTSCSGCSIPRRSAASRGSRCSDCCSCWGWGARAVWGWSRRRSARAGCTSMKGPSYTRTPRVLDGLEAAYEILGWPDPAVEIFYKRRARQRTVREPLQHVLMEAARLLDESARSTVEMERAVPTAPRVDSDADGILADGLQIEGA